MDLENEIKDAKAKKVNLLVEISKLHDHLVNAERKGEKIPPEKGSEKLSQLKKEIFEVNDYILELEGNG